MVMWKDTSSYSQSDKVRVPSSYTLVSKELRLSVVQHIDNPTVWSLICSTLIGIGRMPLATDLERAKTMALEYAREKLTAMLKELE